jgi:hypothetical protein
MHASFPACMLCRQRKFAASLIDPPPAAADGEEAAAVEQVQPLILVVGAVFRSCCWLCSLCSSQHQELIGLLQSHQLSSSLPS